MKSLTCPRCWTEKVYLREVKGWKRVLLASALLRPVQCHHCYHNFLVHWFSTLFKRIKPSKATTCSAVIKADSPAFRAGTAQTESSPPAAATGHNGYAGQAKRGTRAAVFEKVS